MDYKLSRDDLNTLSHLIEEENTVLLNRAAQDQSASLLCKNKELVLLLRLEQYLKSISIVDVLEFIAKVSKMLAEVCKSPMGETENDNQTLLKGMEEHNG